MAEAKATTVHVHLSCELRERIERLRDEETGALGVRPPLVETVLALLVRGIDAHTMRHVER